MSDFLSKIFGEPKIENGDAALKQGARFNIMQNTITSAVYPQLPLMDQTTSPGIGSITETLDNMNPIAIHPALDGVDDSEVKKLEQMQKKYKTLLFDLKQWQMKVKTSDSAAQMKEYIAAIKQINEKILIQAQNITKQAYKSNKANLNTTNARDIQRKQIRHSVVKMDATKKKLDEMLKHQHSIGGQVEDQQYDLDANYLHYIVWFLATTTIVFVTLKQINK